MRWSQMFIPTLRQTPKEIERGAAFLSRAGYAFVSGGRLTAFLPLGVLCFDRLKRQLSARLSARGAEEIAPWLLQRTEVSNPDIPRPEGFQQAADAPGISDVNRLLREIAGRHLHSYNQLPRLWFCSAPDSRGCDGRFICCMYMSVCEVAREVPADPVPQVFSEIAAMLGLPVIRADSLAVVGREGVATEFLCRSSDGNVQVAECPCGYTADVDCAVSKAARLPENGNPFPGQPRQVETPGMKTIADVSDYLGLPPSSLIKSLLYVASGEPVLVLMRGDDQLNEHHLERALGSCDLRPANPDEIRHTLGAEPGSIGPVGVQRIRILGDDSLRSCHDMASGANKDDYHLTGVEPERDFHAEYTHLRQVCEKDPCPQCARPLTVSWGRLLLRSATVLPSSEDSADLRVLGPDNKPRRVLITCHTVDLHALLLSVVERCSDEDGLVLPPAIAPFDALITPIKYNDDAQKRVCESAYDSLRKQNVRVLIDDRDLTPGVKLKDADLIGIPLRITIGPRKLSEGKVELRVRATGETSDCPIEDVARSVVTIVRSGATTDLPA